MTENEKCRFASEKIQDIIEKAELTALEAFGVLESIKMGISHQVWDESSPHNVHS